MNFRKMFERTKFTLKKNSPTILLVGGIAAGGYTLYSACKSTVKAVKIVENHKKTLETIDQALEAGKLSDGKGGEEIIYTEEDKVSDTRIAFVNTGLSLAKTYAKPAAFGVLSLACILQSHKILSKRNLNLTAAYAGALASYKDLRKKIADKYGDAIEKELVYGVKEIKAKKNEPVDPEAPKKYTITDKKASEYSIYSRFFDDTCFNFDPNQPEYNLMFLKRMQDWANDKLRAQGYLFLNDVYRALGFPETQEGQIVGWVYKLNNEVGDNKVDFGFMDIRNTGAREFVNGRIANQAVLLDFNVDGNVWQILPESEGLNAKGSGNWARDFYDKILK